MGQPPTGEQDKVERSVDVDPEPSTRSDIGNRYTGTLSEPARQHVVGRDVGQPRKDRPSARDRDDIRGIAVVREGRGRTLPRGRDQLPTIHRRRERDRARTEDDQPAVSDVGSEMAESRPERDVVPRSCMERDARRPGGEEPSTVTLDEVEPGDVRRSRERASLGVRLEVQDRDVDVGHASGRRSGCRIAG